MPKAKAVAKTKPAAAKKTAPKLASAKAKPAATKVEKAKPAKAGKPVKLEKKAGGKGRAPAASPPPAAKAPQTPFDAPTPSTPMPRASKLPPVVATLTKREMELLLTPGQGRGVEGEGSLKGRLVVKEGFPYLHVIGRDKRELVFLLEGPDQEVLPAYVDHRVSVSGRIKKTTSYGGVVAVRKYSAKKPEQEAAAPAAPEEQKLKYLSPGDVEQLCAAGMGSGMKGFATLRGQLEMTGDELFLVVSNAGTRQQVSFLISGKAAKGMRKHVGTVVQVSGVAEKSSGWGGTVEAENFEPKPSEYKAVSRDAMNVTTVEGGGSVPGAVEVKLNEGLAVILHEKAGYTWAIEPTTAKRTGLRESRFEPGGSGPATREFFFTPRNPGVLDVDFFLAKAFTPAQVAKTYRLVVTVRP